jgi:hypothetical protein
MAEYRRGLARERANDPGIGTRIAGHSRETHMKSGKNGLRPFTFAPVATDSWKTGQQARAQILAKELDARHGAKVVAAAINRLA